MPNAANQHLGFRIVDLVDDPLIADTNTEGHKLANQFLTAGRARITLQVVDGFHDPLYYSGG
jgi:hypothetical protein